MSRRPVAAYSRSVFVNCPYDTEYLPMLQALVFTVHACGFEARLATSADCRAFPGIRRGAAARGYVTRLPLPVSRDTLGALPCELAFGVLPHDGPWKRHREADAEPPRANTSRTSQRYAAGGHRSQPIV